MIKTQIIGGNWDEGALVVSMPQDFVLSARTLFILEENEYAAISDGKPIYQRHCIHCNQKWKSFLDKDKCPYCKREETS